MNDKLREQFEEVAEKEGLSLEVFNGDYNWLNTRLAWKFWQASRESLEVELPNVSGIPHTDYDYGYRDGIEKCETILTSNGVKIKND